MKYLGIFWNILEYSGIFCNIDRQRRTERFFSLVFRLVLISDGNTTVIEPFTRKALYQIKQDYGLFYAMKGEHEIRSY